MQPWGFRSGAAWRVMTAVPVIKGSSARTDHGHRFLHPFLCLMRICFLLLIGSLLLGGSVRAGGAACVMAKHQGQTLDYALVYGKSHPVEAQEAAEAELRAKGYADYLAHLDVIRAQNLSNLDQAYVIVIRSEFADWRGRERSAMGCGFSAASYREAELEAVRDLQAYFWGWKPDQHGYQLVRKFQY